MRSHEVRNIENEVGSPLFSSARSARGPALKRGFAVTRWHACSRYLLPSLAYAMSGDNLGLAVLPGA